MIWGKRKGSGHQWSRWFAWHPVELIDGRYAWLENIERISYMAKEIEPDAPFSLPGWCHREITK